MLTEVARHQTNLGYINTESVPQTLKNYRCKTYSKERLCCSSFDARWVISYLAIEKMS
jgi:hypothetical protein